MITSGASNNIKQRSGRGSFILLEGVDRCGKTTQCGLLVKHLMTTLSLAVVAMRFPDRSTEIGSIINAYLTRGKEVDDHAIHLLFSANRWEAASTLAQHLSDGTTVICDRYAYSGVAFTSAKQKANLSLDWCKAPDQGLPAPDAVIFLDLSPEQAQKRGGYGGERYEESELQKRVRKQFQELQRLDEGNIPWHIIDASQTIPDVQNEINNIVERTIQETKDKPLKTMFGNDIYELPPPSNK